jgi:uncharacterized repeat protein (TIGR03843 family)
MPYASNVTLLARSGDGRLWIYKPERGESPLWDFEWRTLARREVLTYEVAQAMGLDLVPETTLAEGPFGPGSAQAFIDEDLEFDPRTLLTPRLDQRLWPLAVLDIVCNNADRKLGHVIREARSGRLWAIDNGLTFHADPKLRTVLWGFGGDPLPSDLEAALARLEQRLLSGLAERVAELLTPPEAQALTRRVVALKDDPHHPHPPENRPAIPWPVW